MPASYRATTNKADALPIFLRANGAEGWVVGVGGGYQSGNPATSIFGLNTARYADNGVTPTNQTPEKGNTRSGPSTPEIIINYGTDPGATGSLMVTWARGQRQNLRGRWKPPRPWAAPYVGGTGDGELWALRTSTDATATYAFELTYLTGPPAAMDRGRGRRGLRRGIWHHQAHRQEFLGVTTMRSDHNETGWCAYRAPNPNEGFAARRTWLMVTGDVLEPAAAGVDVVAPDPALLATGAATLQPAPAVVNVVVPSPTLAGGALALTPAAARVDVVVPAPALAPAGSAVLQPAAARVDAVVPQATLAAGVPPAPGDSITTIGRSADAASILGEQ